MVSCSTIEIASLVFGFLSLIVNALGSCWLSSRIVRAGIAIFTTSEDKNITDETKALYLQTVTYSITVTTVLLSFLILTFVFSIILIKGLITKRSHLVKAYFIYGVTWNTLTVIFAMIIVTRIEIKTGLLTLLGCFTASFQILTVRNIVVYGLILFMIKKTYLKLATNESSQCSHKKIEEEKSISIKL